jgi:hypothetical protein
VMAVVAVPAFVFAGGGPRSLEVFGRRSVRHVGSPLPCVANLLFGRENQPCPASGRST